MTQIKLPPTNPGRLILTKFKVSSETMWHDLEIERAQILGYSMGAVSALKFSSKWPERVDRLVLVSAMASRLPEEIVERARIIEEMLESEGLRNTYEFYFSGPIFEGESNKKEFKEAIEHVIEKATPHGFQGCFRVTIDRPSMVDELKNIQAPTLILVGERDKHYVIEADLLVSEITEAKKFVVKNSGHALTLQSPDIFEREVLKFLAEPPRFHRWLIFLRRLANEQTTWIFQRSTQACCAPSAGKRT